MSIAEKLFISKTVLTMEKGQPTVEAVAVSRGRIIGLGTRAELAVLCDQNTVTVDLGDATLMPGFVEAHGHPYWSSQTWGEPVVDIRAIHEPTYAAALEKIRRRVAKAKQGDVLWFLGLDAQLHAGMEEPTRAQLDAISAEYPIVVQTSNFHAIYINSKAADHFGIGSDYQAPKDGVMVRDELGRPWKLMEHAAWNVSDRFYDSRGADRITESFGVWLEKFARAGYTTSSEINLAPGGARAVDVDMQRLPQVLRVVGYEAVAAGGAVTMPQGYENGLFAMGGVKIHADGSVLLGNVWTSTPYLTNDMTVKGMGLAPSNTGHALYDAEQLYAKVVRYAREGWQLSVHAHGDRTIDLVLDVYERILKEVPDATGPYRLEHCGMMRDDQIDRAIQLGVVASYFLPYIYHWGEALRDSLLGDQPAARFVPSGNATKRGMRVSYHCDSPMTWPDALKCLYVAVTRKTINGETIGSDQRVDISDALRAVTIDAAYQLRMEDKIGSIAVGKFADFVVLGGNPLTWELDNLLQLPIRNTYIAGNSVFDKSEGS